MKSFPVSLFLFLLMLRAVPCSAQNAQAPLSAAAAHTKKQDAMAPFTRAEVIQFFHTVQAQAMSWKDTVSSIEPSALRIDDQTSGVIKDEKSQLLYYLGDIEKLRPDSDGKYKGLDLETTATANSLIRLGGEFWLFNDICEFKEGVLHLSDTLMSHPDGEADAAELLQIYKEAETAKVTLWTEIMNRVVGAGLQTVGRSAQKPCKE
jgi:hypothetical protein